MRDENYGVGSCSPGLPRLHRKPSYRPRTHYRANTIPYVHVYRDASRGEVGELCNVLKKLRRGDVVDMNDVRRELGDIVTYTDLLAPRSHWNRSWRGCTREIQRGIRAQGFNPPPVISTLAPTRQTPRL
jgi:hypothetical protein